MKRLYTNHLCRHGSSLLAAALVACIVVALKLVYNQADSHVLQWILLPTASLVAFFTNMEFIFEQGVGYLCFASGVAIAPSCSGFNYLIICFCSGAFHGICYLDSLKGKLAWICLILLCSCLFTILVNSMRVLLSMELYLLDIYGGPITKARVHRIIGVSIFFPALCLYNSWLSCTLGAIRNRNRVKVHQQPGWEIKKPVLWPLLCYLLFVIAIPMVRGGSTHITGPFIEHGATVTAISLITVFLIIRAKTSEG